MPRSTAVLHEPTENHSRPREKGRQHLLSTDMDFIFLVNVTMKEDII